MSAPSLQHPNNPTSQLVVLYEDDQLLFVNKPPDIIVARSHDPADTHAVGTAVGEPHIMDDTSLLGGHLDTREAAGGSM